MLRVEDHWADQAGHLRPGQGLVQPQIPGFISGHQALGLQAGGGDLLGAGDLCCLDGIDQRGCGHGSDKKQGYQFALFHARFLLFGYGWGFATRTIPQTVAEVETNRHTARKIDEQIYSATATTHQR